MEKILKKQLQFVHGHLKIASHPKVLHRKLCTFSSAKTVNVRKTRMYAHQVPKAK